MGGRLMVKGQYPIPFDVNGNQQHYPLGAWGGTPCVFQEPVWRDNFVFADLLTYKDYRRGRSAAYFQFTRQDGTTVCMFLTDMEKAIPYMVRGVLQGRFTFIKRGQNYGVQLVQD